MCFHKPLPSHTHMGMNHWECKYVFHILRPLMGWNHLKIYHLVFQVCFPASVISCFYKCQFLSFQGLNLGFTEMVFNLFIIVVIFVLFFNSEKYFKGEKTFSFRIWYSELGSHVCPPPRKCGMLFDSWPFDSSSIRWDECLYSHPFLYITNDHQCLLCTTNHKDRSGRGIQR